MSRCLDRKELTGMVDMVLDSTKPQEEAIRVWMNEADPWDEEIVGLTYFLSQILVRRDRSSPAKANVIAGFFTLEETMWFSVEEFSTAFIDYMLRNTRDGAISLEDDIVDVVTKMRHHRYEHTLRM